jgi:phosphate transport system substrate-binding protein
VKRILAVPALLALVVLIGTGGCIKNGGGGSDQVKRLNLSGATFIEPMMGKWSSGYQKVTGVQVNYAGKGSGTGINEMIAGTVDFGCSDAPMNDEQLKAAKEKGGDVVHIPLAMGAVVAAYNLPEVENPLNFTGEVLADIYLGKITKWNDEKIQKLNEGVNLPDKKISVCHRSDGSGTTYIFVDYLCKVSPEFDKQIGRGTTVKWPEGMVGAPKNNGVAQFVGSTDGAIGYVELIYALSDPKIKYASVKNKDGEFVKPSLESVTAAAAGATIPDDLRYSITNASGKEAYPIAGTNWAIVYVLQPANKKATIVEFLRWITHDGQQYCADLKYSALPKGIVEKIDKKLGEIKAK